VRSAVEDLPPDPDSSGCLCVVASFVNAARTVDDVTKEAAKRVMMSPVLSDFIEFRFADLGSHPGQDGDYSAGLRAIVNALLRPQAIAGRNYFAVVVVDRSAVIAAHVLSQCAGSPFISALRPRFFGISNSDDRPARDRSGPPRIMTSPTGIWSKNDDMVAVLYRFADGLQRSLVASHETGLPAAELAGLRTRYHQQARPAVGPGAATDHAPGQGPDVLASPPPSAVTASVPVLGNQQASVPPPSIVSASAGAPAPAAADEADVALASPERREPPKPASRARRWLPELRWQRGEQPAAGAADAEPEPSIERLVYLLIVGDESSREEAALNRGRSALLEVDKKLAELPGFSFRVRMLYGDEDSLRGEMREAGQLGRRDVKRIVGGGDFAAVLDHIRASLRRDPAARKVADVSPTVLLFTPEPPLADATAAGLFRELALEAMVIWALPRSAKALLSESFTDVVGVQVIADDQGVADEVAALLGDAADAVQATAAKADT
jgi:hypothetical protein